MNVANKSKKEEVEVVNAYRKAVSLSERKIKGRS
jgi:hypothetical protein